MYKKYNNLKLQIAKARKNYVMRLLAEKGIIKKACRPVKVLGNGKLTKKLTVKLNAFSASAAEKINSVGGKAEVI